MIKKVLIGIKKIFTGEAIDEECQRYVTERKPQTAADVERLQSQFWAKKAQVNGYFLELPRKRGL